MLTQRRSVVCARWVFVGVLLCRSSWALGPDGSAIESSDYTIDFHEGPIQHGTRINGLGGSLAPLAEGVEGIPVNPATASLRVPWSDRWFDWDLGGGVSGPSALPNTDRDNNGDPDNAEGGDLFFRLGLGFQFGRWGAGIHFDRDRYRVQSRSAEGDDRRLDVGQVRMNVVGSYAVLDGQLAFGAGLGVHSIDLAPSTTEGTQANLASVQGLAFSLGSTWSPLVLPLRVGASVRVPVQGSKESEMHDGVDPDENGDYVTEGYYVPRHLTVPLEAQLGIAVQLFRPLNGPWLEPPRRKRKTDRESPPDASTEDAPKPQPENDSQPRRRHLLLSAALKTTLPVENGVGIESFLTQVVERSGRDLVFSPRVGIEGEPVANWLVLRGGSYLEPTRFADGKPRWHGTGGFDVHLPIRWRVFGLVKEGTPFRLSAALDGAPRYLSWSAAIGIWR